MSHAAYYPGAEPMALKLLFDPGDGSILGAQAVGGAGVDKRIDVLATAMRAGITADELADLELAYAPPFSSAKDPVNMLGYMAENILSGDCDVVESEEVAALASAGWTVLDVRTEAEHARGAIPGRVKSRSTNCARRWHGRPGPVPRLLRGRPARPHGHHAPARTGLAARNLDGGYRTWSAADAAAALDPGRLVGARRDPAQAGGVGSNRASGLPINLAENFTALTALVTPVWSAAPITMRITPSQKSSCQPSIRMPRRPSM